MKQRGPHKQRWSLEHAKRESAATTTFDDAPPKFGTTPRQEKLAKKEKARAK